FPGLRSATLGMALAFFLAASAQGETKTTLMNKRGVPVDISANHDSLWADVTIAGTVLDVNGEPLPGVTVSVAGTTIGTVTDLDGRYSIAVPEGSTLTFSFIGFETQNVQIGGRNQVDITMNEELSA